MHIRKLVLSILLAVLVGFVSAQTIRIGAVASATGPASALGEPEANTLKLLQDEYNAAGGIAGVPVEIIFLDSATDSAQALTSVSRLIEENDVHAIICCTTSGNSMAILDTVQGAGVPMISMASIAPIIEPVEERFWVFKTPQIARVVLEAVVADIVSEGGEPVSFIAQEGAFGEEGATRFAEFAPAAGLEVVASEAYNRSDTNFTAQILKSIASRPDAVIVWGTVRDSALVIQGLRERGYEGQIYASHGVGNPSFIENGGDAVQGARIPIGPMVVVNELADDNPVKQVASDYISWYEAEFGEGTASTFGGHAWDAMKLLEKALDELISEGADLSETAAARAAIRDRLESMGPMVGVHGTFDYTATDHMGLDNSGVVLTEVQGTGFVLVRE